MVHICMAKDNWYVEHKLLTLNVWMADKNQSFLIQKGTGDQWQSSISQLVGWDPKVNYEPSETGLQTSPP